MKWSFYAGFLWLLLTAPCWGQITVPESVERDTLAVATLSNPIPDGAYLADGGWELIGATNKQKPSSYDDGTTLVFTGTPGDYTVIYDGILLQDVTFQDGQGNSVTIRSYVGRIKERAAVTVKGDVGPDPPPPPPANAVAVILEETDQPRPPWAAKLWGEIRQKWPDQPNQPSRVLILDDDQREAQQVVQQVIDSRRPLLVIGIREADGSFIVHQAVAVEASWGVGDVERYLQ